MLGLNCTVRDGSCVHVRCQLFKRRRRPYIGRWWAVSCHRYLVSGVLAGLPRQHSPYAPSDIDNVGGSPRGCAGSQLGSNICTE